MERLLDIVTTLCIGLMIGTEFAVSVFINPILGKLEHSAEAQATRLFALKLGATMPFWYGLSLLLLVAEMVVRRHQPGVTLLGAASAIWVGVIVFTAVAGAYKQPHREDGFRKIRISFLPSLRTLFER
jgi:uncharacterized membrane protein